jgi:predicted Zn-dependent peptidase
MQQADGENSVWHGSRPSLWARTAACAAIAFGLWAQSASAAALHLPSHEKKTLKNGLTVLLLEKHNVPMVSFYLVVKAGSAEDPANEAGLASVTAGLLRKGTKLRTAQQFAADLDDIGGEFDADAGQDFSMATAEFLSKDLNRGIELFSDALLHPVFPQEEVDKLLRQALDGVKAEKDEAQSVLGAYYDAYLFGNHPYGRPVDGDENSLARIKREAIVKFYETHYAPGNAILAVAGDFSAPDMEKRLEEALGPWAGRPTPAPAIPAASQVKGKRMLLVDKPDATQTFFAIGNVGVTRNDPDRAAIRVVNTIFGGRFTSMLNEELRVKSGLTYGAWSGFSSLKEPGSFGMYSFTRNETTVKAIDMALQVLDELHKKGVNEEQLTSAKSYLKGQFPPTMETSGQLARLIAANEFYGLDDSEVNDFEGRVDAVTPEVARRVIEKRFPLDNLVFALIGKAADIRTSVQKYATQLDTTDIAAPGFWPPVPKAPKD